MVDKEDNFLISAHLSKIETVSSGHSSRTAEEAEIVGQSLTKYRWMILSRVELIVGSS